MRETTNYAIFGYNVILADLIVLNEGSFLYFKYQQERSIFSARLHENKLGSTGNIINELLSKV